MMEKIFVRTGKAGTFMKKYAGIIALLLAVAMLFGACSATTGDDDILATVSYTHLTSFT